MSPDEVNPSADVDDVDDTGALDELLPLVTVSQAAAMLGVTRDSVHRRMIPSGDLKPLGKIRGYRGAIVFTLEEVERAVRQTAVLLGADEATADAYVAMRAAFAGVRR